MVANEQDTPLKSARRGSGPSWPRVVIGLLITGLTFWFIYANVELGDVWSALRTANPVPIMLGIGVMVLTSAVKALRWQRIYFPASDRPSLFNAFKALMLNHFVNNVIIGRFGELARAYNINRSSGIGIARTLGTIIVEKSLDALYSLITVLAILPWVVLPDNITNPVGTIALTTVGLIVVLYLLAFQTNFVLNLTERIAQFFPAVIGRRLVGLTRGGLKGLAALRDSRSMLEQLGISAIVAFLYVLLPFTLFRAFDLPFTLVDAAVLHLWTTIATSIPTTPGRIGVFEGAVLALLTQLSPTTDTSILLSFAIIFHIVVLIPNLVLGGLAAIGSDWGWRQLDNETA